MKIIGLSVDPVDSHSKWANDIRETQAVAPNYPMIGDPDLSISKLYGMLPASASGDPAKRSPADNQAPANWKQGEDVIIAGSVSDDAARKTYPDGWKAPRPRSVPLVGCP